MKLKNISVKNFRCYASLSLDLHPQLTVLVANNGGGKTTLLDAICKSLWQYLKSFDLAYSIETNRQNRIHFKDMRLLKSGEEMARQLPCEIITNADYGEGLKTWKIYAHKEVKRTKHRSDQATKLLNKFSKDH